MLAATVRGHQIDVLAQLRFRPALRAVRSPRGANQNGPFRFFDDRLRGAQHAFVLPGKDQTAGEERADSKTGRMISADLNTDPSSLYRPRSSMGRAATPYHRGLGHGGRRRR